LASRDTVRKLITIENRRVFRTMSTAPTATKGSIGALPTHQLAVWLMVSAVSATAKATGLKRCFPRMATMYLEAIDQTAAHVKNHRSCVERAGSMIRARMSAEM